ncbi:hypothetical protein OsJ_22336 [Oryza sativa Japonica Group]|uniref:Uncharacterized protein n=1 Tax=Oryza sativa subsp. japonica TaxID=39947 RepID=B9FQG3_ORYSJ|nr:hypothetical protein OsJ_22336 [Oryza sativa Japonica Group]BAD46294.1 hypothetical protein [Oryza sativa Japonica Group]BAD46685.1 hypothetical protein [Oryza sativa Japonica Group]
MVAAVVGEAEMVESAMDLQGQSVTWPHRLLPLALLVPTALVLLLRGSPSDHLRTASYDDGGFPSLATGKSATGFAQVKVVPAHFVFSGEPLSRKAVFFLISGETFSRGS